VTGGRTTSEEPSPGGIEAQGHRPLPQRRQPRAERGGHLHALRRHDPEGRAVSDRIPIAQTLGYTVAPPGQD